MVKRTLILQQIEINRRELHHMACSEARFIDQQVLEKSRQLDRLINTFYLGANDSASRKCQ